MPVAEAALIGGPQAFSQKTGGPGAGLISVEEGGGFPPPCLRCQEVGQEVSLWPCILMAFAFISSVISGKEPMMAVE